MHGTPTEVAVADALAAAVAAEEHQRSSTDTARVVPSEIACAALIRLRLDGESTAGLIKDVVFVDEPDPMPYEELGDVSSGHVICVDLTDGGSVWCTDENGHARWLPDEEFQLRADAEREDDEVIPQVSLAEVAGIVVLVAAIGLVLMLALWFGVLPSGN